MFQPPLMRDILRPLGSLRLTFFLLGLLVAGIFVISLAAKPMSVFLAAVLLAMAFNLLAAILTRPGFRRRFPLVLFHVALLLVIVLVALGRLIYLRGQAEVIEGQAFAGELVRFETGVWHPWGLDRVSFVNHGFRISYAPGMQRLKTYNRVSWTTGNGDQLEAVIGDDQPLVLNGYRFYTTWNKGFALIFAWKPEFGQAAVGSVNLPSFPANALKQAQEWHLPGVPEPVWAALNFDGELIPADSDGEFRLPDDYRVVVRYLDQRWELVPGKSTVVDLPSGQLHYVGLRTWMGYFVTWDATIPWLLAASCIAVLALALHFWQRFAANPWNPSEIKETSR